MDTVEKLYETPAMISGTVDFGLSDETKNRTRGHALMARPDATVLDETDAYTLFRAGGDDAGYLVLFNKPQDRIDYFVQYETMQRRLTGLSVTQVAIWRAVAIPYYPNITSAMFFDYLLPHFGAIMSDERQTIDGRRFWLRMMANAAAKDMQVGFVDFRGSQIELFDSSTNSDVVKWASTRGAWGKGAQYEDRRFLIKA